MIHLSFNWLYFMIGVIMVVSIYYANRFFKANDKYDLNDLLGCFILYVAIFTIILIIGVYLELNML